MKNIDKMKNVCLLTCFLTPFIREIYDMKTFIYFELSEI